MQLIFRPNWENFKLNGKIAVFELHFDFDKKNCYILTGKLHEIQSFVMIYGGRVLEKITRNVIQ